MTDMTKEQQDAMKKDLAEITAKLAQANYQLVEAEDRQNGLAAVVTELTNTNINAKSEIVALRRERENLKKLLAEARGNGKALTS